MLGSFSSVALDTRRACFALRAKTLHFIEPNVPWVSVITVPGIHVREGNRPGLCAKGERTIKRPATQPVRFVRSGYADTAVANSQAGTVDLSSPMRKPTQLIVASTTPMRERANNVELWKRRRCSVIT